MFMFYVGNGDIILINDDCGDGFFNLQIVFQVDSVMQVEIELGMFNNVGLGDVILLLVMDFYVMVLFDFLIIEGELIEVYIGYIDSENQIYSYLIQFDVGQMIYVVVEIVSGDFDIVFCLVNF